MSHQEFDPFDSESVVCTLTINVGGDVSYHDHANGKTDTVPGPAVILTAVFHRMQVDPDFNQQMLEWAQENFGAHPVNQN